MRCPRSLVILVLLACSVLSLGARCDATYVDGVYWIKADAIYVDATVHNDEPGDKERIGTVWIVPPGTEAWAPPGYKVDPLFPRQMLWVPVDPLHGGIDPGASLSGFLWATPVGKFPGEYWHKVGRHEPNSGYFTPVLIPEPAFAFYVAMVLLGTYTLRRRIR